MSLEDPRRHTTAARTPLPARIRLSASTGWAELTADDLTETGVVLSTGPSPEQMAEQSHVERGDPSWLLHDYTHRISAVLRAAAPRLWGDVRPVSDAQAGIANDDDGDSDTLGDGGSTAGPRSVLHLGAGALTLPRWIEERWPQASQTVLDIEPDLVGFVLEHLPMRTTPESVVADAAEALSPGGVMSGRDFEAVIVDLFNSPEAPEQLTSPEFFSAVLQGVAPQGLLLVNLGDDAGMAFARRVIHTLLELVPQASCALLTAPDPVLAGEEEGNLVFACTPSSPFSQPELQLIWAAGPHPGDVLIGPGLEDWAR